MKKFLQTAWTVSGSFLALVYCIASLSSFIPPLSFSFITLFAIAFPYIFFVVLAFCIISFFIARKTAIFLLLLLPLGYFNLVNTFPLRTKQKWTASHDSSTLRIMTWNVASFHNFEPISSPFAQTRIQMLETISELNPDILCLQEYRNVENSKRQVSVRKELADLGYNHFICSNDRKYKRKNLEITDGVAIFSKHPFSDTGRIVISNKDRAENMAYADIDFNNRKLRIFTAHLISFYLYPDTAAAHDSGSDIYKITYNRKRSIQWKLRDTEKSHQKQVTLIRKELEKSPFPVIYCGDINATPTSYTYRKLKGSLQDAFLSKGSGFGTTFYKIIPTLRIDVCFADTSFHVVQSKVEERKLSDHYPVISDLKWK